MSEENKTESSFCLKCKKHCDIKDSIVKTTKNNRMMMSGLCSVCNTRTNKFLKKQVENKVDEVKKEDVKVKWDEKEDDKKEDVKVDEVKDIIEKYEKKIKQVKRNNIKKPLID